MGYKQYSVMKGNYNKIRINGKSYNREIISELFISQPIPVTMERENRKVFDFVMEWLDENEAITVSTSGSTGKPKKIALLKKNMIQSAILTSQYLGLKKNMTAMLCMPVNYIAGKMMIVRAFVTGYNLITAPPSANPFGQLTRPVNFTALTPYQLFHSFSDIKRLKIDKILVGGGEISADLEKRANDLSTELFATYGMTETYSHVALRKINGPDSTEIYSALDGISFYVDNRDCLVIHAPMLAENDLVTNDMVGLIDKHHFRWLGRYDNVINTGGIKVFPETIERKISGLITVPFFISSVKDEELNQKVVLVIEGKPFEKDYESQLMEQISNRLLRYEVPKSIRYTDKFLYSKSGKILRTKSFAIK